MTMRSPKMVYAQSSDIRSRTYLEYRRDMKKKGIAELEFLPYLEGLLKERRGDGGLKVSKHGGDAMLWFARSGGNVTQDPDYLVRLSTGERFLYEFQIAETGGLRYFDFKVSKVGRKPRGAAERDRRPHADREFFYVVKDENRYAFFTPEWIMRNGEYGFVSAWRSWAYRVPGDVFLAQFADGGERLRDVIQSVDNKNGLLEFQHDFLESESRKLSKRLQQVVDDETLFKIVPRTLEGFYQVCYLLDKLGKEPDAPGVWMVYLLTFFRDDMRSIDFARFMYALDFLYFKCADIKRNETQVLRQAILDASDYVSAHAKADGSLSTDPRESPLEETRRLIFAVNLLEDIRQDAAVSFGMDLPLVAKIFETIPNAELTANYVRDALRG